MFKLNVFTLIAWTIVCTLHIVSGFRYGSGIGWMIVSSVCGGVVIGLMVSSLLYGKVNASAKE